MPEDNKTTNPETPKGETQGVAGKSEEELASILENPDDSQLTPEQKAFKNKILKEYREKRAREGEEMASLKARVEESEKWRGTAEKSGVELKADKQEGLKLLDQMINQAEPAAKENLRQIREIIRQETDVDKLSAEISEIKKVLGQYQNVTQVQLQSRIQEQMTKWERDYGKEIVHKYGDKLKSALVGYPDLQPSQVFKNIVSDEDYEVAIATKFEKRKQEEVQRKRQAASPISGEVSSDEGPPERDKYGRVLLRPMIEKALKGIVPTAKE